MEYNYTILPSDEYRDLCERVAIAEERLERLWDYIEQEDISSSEICGERAFNLVASDVKLITGYTEKMAAFAQIKKNIEDFRMNNVEEEEDEV